MKRLGDAIRSAPDGLLPNESEAFGEPAPTYPAPPAIPVFPIKELRRLACKLTPDKERRLTDLVHSAIRNGGQRIIPQWDDLATRMHALYADFPNFSGALEALESELILACSLKPSEFYVSPLLLHGAPGIGKTLLANRLAKELGLPFTKISASGAQGAFTLVGTSSHWSNTHPGRIFELLAESDFASGVVLIDEIDKFGDDDRYPVLPALLDLLEKDSARQFRDESAGVEFDASRLIIVLTANTLATIHGALLSRVQAYAVNAPDTAQRATLIRDLVERLEQESGHVMHLDEHHCQNLAACPTDLRELHRRIRRAFAQAIKLGETHLRLTPPTEATPRKMGFI